MPEKGEGRQEIYDTPVIEPIINLITASGCPLATDFSDSVSLQPSAERLRRCSLHSPAAPRELGCPRFVPPSSDVGAKPFTGGNSGICYFSE